MLRGDIQEVSGRTEVGKRSMLEGKESGAMEVSDFVVAKVG